MIHVIIVGACGRMGKMITRGIAEEKDMRIVGAITSPTHPMLGQDVGEIAGVSPMGVPVTNRLSSIVDAGDVVIDFTSPQATIRNLEVVVEASKPIVIGTTGFDADEFAEVNRVASDIPCVMSPNMSLCVNVLLQVIPSLAKAH